MSREITWRNIDAPDFRASADLMNQAQASFQNAFAGIQNAVEGYHKHQVDRNTNEYLMGALQAHTPEELQSYMQGAGADLISRAGGNFNPEALLQARQHEANTLQNQMNSLTHTMTRQDFDSQAAMHEVASYIASGQQPPAELLQQAIMHSNAGNLLGNLGIQNRSLNQADRHHADNLALTRQKVAQEQAYQRQKLAMAAGSGGSSPANSMNAFINATRSGALFNSLNQNPSEMPTNSSVPIGPNNEGVGFTNAGGITYAIQENKGGGIEFIPEYVELANQVASLAFNGSKGESLKLLEEITSGMPANVAKAYRASVDDFSKALQSTTDNVGDGRAPILDNVIRVSDIRTNADKVRKTLSNSGHSKDSIDSIFELMHIALQNPEESGITDSDYFSPNALAKLNADGNLYGGWVSRIGDRIADLGDVLKGVVSNNSLNHNRTLWNAAKALKEKGAVLSYEDLVNYSR